MRMSAIQRFMFQRFLSWFITWVQNQINRYVNDKEQEARIKTNDTKQIEELKNAPNNAAKITAIKNILNGPAK